jgi:putative spermidine/putrescine transport system ATP-binding protein
MPGGDIAAWEGITKRYGAEDAVTDVSLGVARGEFLTLLGPSGSGKTTLLHILAGLTEPTSGQVVIEGRDVTGEPPYERSLGMVFQSLALFPHMDVFSNVAFPLRMRRVGRAETATRVRAALEIVRLPHVERRHVRALCGGQRQRIALARALVYEPPLLLLDEPLGALDRRLREDMQIELMRLHRDLDVTIVNVTHDQREALMLSDRIGIMQEGRVVQVATPETLYRDPATLFVASFLGDPVLIAGEVVADGGTRRLRHGGLELEVAGDAPLGPGTLVLRSESVAVMPEPPAEGRFDNRLEARIELAAFEGSGTYYEARAADDVVVKVLVQGGATATLGIGEAVWLGWNAADAPVLVEP